MSIVIRMSRLGRTNRAHFRLGVYPKRSRRDGPAIELLGHYDPRSDDAAKKITFDAERIQYWAGKGAEVSSAVRLFLNKAGVKLPAKKSNKPNLRSRRAKAKKAGGQAPKAAAPKAAPKAPAAKPAGGAPKAGGSGPQAGGAGTKKGS
jgi:small subunit ribosomal protein S16